MQENAKNTVKQAFNPFNGDINCGAVEQIRTVDLFLTKEVLCLLSYNSEKDGDPDGARTHDL